MAGVWGSVLALKALSSDLPAGRPRPPLVRGIWRPCLRRNDRPGLYGVGCGSGHGERTGLLLGHPTEALIVRMDAKKEDLQDTPGMLLSERPRRRRVALRFRHASLKASES